MRPEDMVLTPQGLRFAGRLWPCSIGRGGVRADKREGDGATPAGVHRLVGCLYRPDRMARPVDWALPIRPGDLWSDDPRHEDYNLMVRAPYPHSHERLRRGDPLYDLVLLTDWNWPRAERGRGSAIFLHRWRRPGFATEGCIAFRPEHLRRIVTRITYGTRLVVPQDLAGRGAG
ncbi:L,D-transpeptidase [Salipiger marinus]|uniref:L,D-transpeptidase family protein n=1 Tax=Salipiger marinus TaxID=555512 RepID=UPI001E62FA2D|nr:L,D-transpeptidase family protein [Salipiger manganoxidans]MEB3418452.1 L,D-transpeptidase family protein [Salipiger manganoxidans]